jgi:hypothetical protein
MFKPKKENIGTLGIPCGASDKERQIDVLNRLKVLRAEGITIYTIEDNRSKFGMSSAAGALNATCGSVKDYYEREIHKYVIRIYLDSTIEELSNKADGAEKYLLDREAFGKIPEHLEEIFSTFKKPHVLSRGGNKGV